MPCSTAKQKRPGEKLLSTLLDGNVGNLECKRLATVCTCRENEHLLMVSLRKNQGSVFGYILAPILCVFGTGGSIAAAWQLKKKSKAGEMEGWEEEWGRQKEGMTGCEGVCHTDCLQLRWLMCHSEAKKGKKGGWEI